jgi:hypothetical protein
VTFEEHLENFRNEDGSYDLAAAEAARAEELTREPGEIDRLARKAASAERAAWERSETQNLRKRFTQPALSPDLELDVMVPLGGSMVARYGDMNPVRIRLRKDLRTKSHLDENRAYDAEMTHWMQTELLLDDGETIGEALRRLGGP